jgi:HAD superfamily hydrolase (TIGR01509 family)
MTPELIIFDCDGVLVDSESTVCGIVADLLTQAGIAITTSEVVRRYAGVRAASMYAELERVHGVALPDGFAHDVHRATLQAFREQLKPMRSVDDVLRGMTFRRCVASSSEPERIALALTVTGLLRHFDGHLFSASQVRAGKPAPDLFLHAARTMGVEPGACLVIEDSVAGIEAARRAGMRAVGFCGGSHCGPTHGGQLIRAGAARTFDRFDRWDTMLGEVID